MCDGYTSALAVVCALTSFTIYIPVYGTNGGETLQVLVDSVLFSIFGCPLVIIREKETSFSNNVRKALAALYVFRWIFVVRYLIQYFLE